MKWLVRLVNWFQRKTWWRRYYKRINLSERQVLEGRCLHCHACTPGKESLRCDIIKDRDCPCKYNQCLKFKREVWI